MGTSSDQDVSILYSMVASLGLVSPVICMLEISSTFDSHFLQVFEPGHCCPKTGSTTNDVTLSGIIVRKILCV